MIFLAWVSYTSSEARISDYDEFLSYINTINLSNLRLEQLQLMQTKIYNLILIN